MVLAELGGSISHALERMYSATIIDEQVLSDCVNDITRALLRADVQFSLVRDLHINVNKIADLQKRAAGHNKRKIIQEAVFNELRKMLDPGKPSFAPTKGKPSVVMFVGLQGSGKTTTCTKYAYHHLSKGWRPALVCADVFRAGAVDQLKQNAYKVNIPFYGSYTESDPLKVAVEGVERFKKENRDLIIVDTSGRHMQETALFEEMRQLSLAIKPDLVVFVMDSRIGQAAFEQALAFKQSVDVGAVIVTKMDGHAKGGGALSAVAATKSPVIFIGTGEHLHEFQAFDAARFVRGLLGVRDFSGFINQIHKVVPEDEQSELIKRLSGGKFTLRIMYDLFQNILRMGPASQILSTLTGLVSTNDKGQGGLELAKKIKRYMTMMDSMTNQELDCSNPKLMNEARAMRIARGSGRPIADVMAMLEEYKRLAKALSKNKGLLNMNMNPQYLGKALPPQMLKQFGGLTGLRALGFAT